jgi:DNA polymerase (family 10)
MNNVDIARVFSEIADILEIKGKNPFRVRSYRQAARTLFDLTQPLKKMVKQGEDLTKLSGIGKSHAEKIEEIVKTGKSTRLEELRKDFPEALTELMSVPGLGPKKVALLYRELGVESLEDLEQALRAQRIRDLEGMGQKTEENIAKGLETLQGAAGRISIKEAEDRLADIGAHLDEIKEIEQWRGAGSLRRAKETIGDLDVLVVARNRNKAIKRILEYDQIDEVLAQGNEKVFVTLKNGLEVDFRFFEQSAFGAALMYFTGSKAHNVELRKLAQKKGWKLNEYGVFDGDKKLAGQDEKAVYEKCGLQWVPPELRENRGEIEAARKGGLPALIAQSDLKGDLHAHTDASDGTATIEEMVAAARKRAYAYLAITDHSQAVRVTQGLDEKRLARHAEAIRKVDLCYDDIWVLAGIEVDILRDGSLDLSFGALKTLDWVIASVHSYFGLPKKDMTRRLIKAIDSGVVHCLGHPLGRMIGSRDPIDFDVDKVFDACRKNNVYLEINAHPQRLDLPPSHCRQAKDKGVKMVINTDAHKVRSLDLIRYGVGVARRGWLEKKDVINTVGAKKLKNLLQKTRTKNG